MGLIILLIALAIILILVIVAGVGKSIFVVIIGAIVFAITKFLLNKFFGGNNARPI